MANGDRAPFLAGGKNSMFGPRGTGTQSPGVSSQEGKSAIGSSGDPQAGGASDGYYSSGATNKDFAGPQAAGTSSPTKSGGNAKFAEGGKGSMFGNTGSTPAVGGRSGVGR